MSQHSVDDVVRNYARDVLGMQREDLNEFLWIADEAMRAPLPEGWEQHEDESRGKPCVSRRPGVLWCLHFVDVTRI